MNVAFESRQKPAVTLMGMFSLAKRIKAQFLRDLFVFHIIKLEWKPVNKKKTDVDLKFQGILCFHLVALQLSLLK